MPGDNFESIILNSANSRPITVCEFEQTVSSIPPPPPPPSRPYPSGKPLLEKDTTGEPIIDIVVDDTNIIVDDTNIIVDGTVGRNTTADIDGIERIGVAYLEHIFSEERLREIRASIAVFSIVQCLAFHSAFVSARHSVVYWLFKIAPLPFGAYVVYAMEVREQSRVVGWRNKYSWVMLVSMLVYMMGVTFVNASCFLNEYNERGTKSLYNSSCSQDIHTREEGVATSAHAQFDIFGAYFGWSALELVVLVWLASAVYRLQVCINNTRSRLSPTRL
jgi:hypothetical protein